MKSRDVSAAFLSAKKTTTPHRIARTILARWLALQRLRISARNSARRAYRLVTMAFMNLISKN
jgi:hypothetical protein